MNTSQKLDLLNALRMEEGLTPFKDWRVGRHQPMLDAYVAAHNAKRTDLAAAVQSGDFAGNKAVQAAAAESAKTKTYKQVARYDKSAVDNVCGFVHQFLSDNPGMTRKEAVIALTEGYGVNYSTARTQYQRWFSAQKKS